MAALADPMQQMVQGLQEDMKGLKTQLKKRQRSDVDRGSVSRHHSRGRRTSRGPPSVHRHGRRCLSSSPSEVDSDHDSQSDRSSSSNFKTTGPKRSKRKAKRYRDSRSDTLPPPPQAPAMGAIPGGYYPYNLLPHGPYAYMYPPPQSCYNGGLPSHGATEAYPSLYKGTVCGGRASEVAGREWEGHRSQRQWRSGSELIHSSDHRFWDGKVRGGWVPGEVGRGGALHDSNGDWSDGGAAAAASASRNLGVERVVADGKLERGDEQGVRSGGDERGEGATSPRGDGEGHGAETASSRKRKSEKKGEKSGISSGASGPRDSKRWRRHREGSDYRCPPAGFAFPPPMGASHHPFAFAPPPLGGPGGGYPHMFPYQVPSDPRTMYDGHFPEAPGWGDGHPYTAASAPTHPSYDDRHGSRRRLAHLSVPEDVGDDRRRSTPMASSVGGGSEVERGRSSSGRSVENKSRSRSPSESGGQSGSEM